MRIGPVLEVTTSLKNFKHGIEIRIWSVGQDNSQSWVRISYGTIKYVVESTQNNTEIPADPQEDQVPQTSIKVVAARSKAKAKPQQREPVDTTTTIPMHERRWIDIKPSEQNLTVFRIIISANQLSLYGAVANIYEEFEAHQDRSGEPDVLMGQSIVLSEIKTEVPLESEDPSHHQILWQQYIQQIESLSLESKVSKFYMEAGFVHVVEVGQYFMTLVILDNFVQWLVANTLFPEMMNHHDQEDGFQET